MFEPTHEKPTKEQLLAEISSFTEDEMLLAIKRVKDERNYRAECQRINYDLIRKSHEGLVIKISPLYQLETHRHNFDSSTIEEIVAYIVLLQNSMHGLQSEQLKRDLDSTQVFWINTLTRSGVDEDVYKERLTQTKTFDHSNSDE